MALAILAGRGPSFRNGFLAKSEQFFSKTCLAMGSSFGIVERSLQTTAYACEVAEISAKFANNAKAAHGANTVKNIVNSGREVGGLFDTAIETCSLLTGEMFVERTGEKNVRVKSPLRIAKSVCGLTKGYIDGALWINELGIASLGSHAGALGTNSLNASLGLKLTSRTLGVAAASIDIAQKVSENKASGKDKTTGLKNFILSLLTAIADFIIAILDTAFFKAIPCLIIQLAAAIFKLLATGSILIKDVILD